VKLNNYGNYSAYIVVGPLGTLDPKDPDGPCLAPEGPSRDLCYPKFRPIVA
jgi:hypothetical protein